MRWIKHDKANMEIGEVAPPTGDLFFVDGNGSKAIVNGVLYIDGKPAPIGQHEIKLENGDTLLIDIDAKGKAVRKAIRKGGGKVG
ncbi:hypothetical protein L1N85_11435 [Paenibacillus alkaliterrae]|uniref:hypothetical protein n=1 Tax=Paenibacillus alkaliterrae TaxID=320909 RepID=UPI001F2420A4|nr:hypothetical protein [Paenibacillus alkaliterrae]MCF2939049.1 hypothetical protein [Paenibacillus alkaliterrae]